MNHVAKKANLAVFVSGTGSNLRALYKRQYDDSTWPVAVTAVVSNKPDCLGAQFAGEAGIPLFAHSPKEFASKEDYENNILSFLKEQNVDYIALAGYMKLIGAVLLNAYPKRIINIHPSLLPAYPGKQAVQDAWDDGASVTGVTVHYVDEGIDTGQVIAQQPVAVAGIDSLDELYTRIHEVEHQFYGDVLGQVVAQA
ncbi:phosphoribosylglycinamide formyltransferase [Alicyclobacillus sp. SO9]|uniref:phosphoribosylglycinamide formyltransferase n=1 Tax=Alicyclobacillus sp. SO9 TaxID=2665646 RepID=UPI0018E79952|nr:phosphoribosylglycinamide formyltransferase [Alicyclobacillus sp. SO9]QQE78566.1 phosphoribosylglycinamide formyltransferase [Alicyclobacillus sp. SO9]